MKTKVTKIGCSVATGFHLLWLSFGIMAGEGILFGLRYFDEVIRIFNGTEIIISVVSIILIFKERKIGYILFAVTILSTYIIQLGHWMFWWPCDYCSI